MEIEVSNGYLIRVGRDCVRKPTSNPKLQTRNFKPETINNKQAK